MNRLLRWLAPDGDADDVIGDLEEAHRIRLRHRRRSIARVLTTVETLEMAAALVRARVARWRINKGGSMVQDYRLGLRMLVKYPGLTIAGGLALAIAIAVGAAWYDLSRDLLSPSIPLPGGDRLVEIDVHNAMTNRGEWRLLHDLADWRRDARQIEELSAFRTLTRNVAAGDTRAEPATVAEITPSAFRLVPVPPLLGRPLLDDDARPGAPPVVVLGHGVWTSLFGQRPDVVGQPIRLGRTTATVVGVMPEGFAFPVNHRLWTPLQIRPSGYEPLEGPAIRPFARLAPGATHEGAQAELTALVERTASSSPRTHEHLRPRVVSYGGELPGGQRLIEFAATHLPILLVLIVACANVGTLIYARTATREAEIAVRSALGASRGRIVIQLFVEALVLASAAAAAGLAAAHAGIRWGLNALTAGRPDALPFWVKPGIEFSTLLYVAMLTVAGAAMLGVLPALKATGRRGQALLRQAGSGGSSLRFGRFWTSVMIAQVALTVICIPPAIGISHEAFRDRLIREPFPDEQYLAAEVELDRDDAMQVSGDDAAYAARLDRTYRELQRRVEQEPGVVAVTFGDRLPGMGARVERAEFEHAPGAAPRFIRNVWMAAVGPRYFESFDVSIVAGRDFHEGDRIANAGTVVVNQAFMQRYGGGASPVGRRVRLASADPATAEPWLEIVGVVEDIGMTPTDLGEAPYVFRAVSPSTASPLVMGVRAGDDAAALAPRLRAIALALDPGLRLADMATLDVHTWRHDQPQLVVGGTIVAVVGLGLFLSAGGIYALMSVSVARRTREIGIRAALGATPKRVLAGIFSRAVVLIGSGVAAGNGVLLLFVALSDEVGLGVMSVVLPMTSGLMFTAGLLACVAPARRALRIQPVDALKEA